MCCPRERYYVDRTTTLSCRRPSDDGLQVDYEGGGQLERLVRPPRLTDHFTDEPLRNQQPPTPNTLHLDRRKS